MSTNAGQDLSTDSRKASRRALVIGIDYYHRTNEDRNLRGCVRDAQKMEEFLHTYLEVSKENIHVLLGAAPQTQENTSSESDVPLRPTRDDILRAIDTIKNESHEGDYVHIHYSGHGTRCETVYAKQGDTHDEALKCADGSIIRDVELGVLLEQMVQEKKLIVSVTLDCCHAGGALRNDEKGNFAIRQQTTTSMPHGIDWIGREIFTSSANSSQEHGNWFWKVRDFNLIAACQPHETAREFTDSEGHRCGLLTFYLLESMKHLHTIGSLGATSYQTLLRMLQARCRSQNHSSVQSPVLFGERRRHVFGLGLDLVDSPDTTMVTRVDMETEEVFLGRGSVDNVAVGDRYQLMPFFGAEYTVDVEVFEVEAFQSYARYTPNPSNLVAEFWLAEPLRSASVLQVTVSPSNEDSTVIDYVNEKWTEYDNDTVPLNFQATEPRDFQIRITRGPNGDRDPVWEIQDGKGNVVPSVPRITATADATEGPKMMKDLCGTLTHLKKYSAFDALKPEPKDFVDPKGFVNPSWEFSIEASETRSTRDDRRNHRERVGTATIRFKNNTGRRVFIAVFNLAPDWSVTQLIPDVSEGSLPVDHGGEIPPFPIDFVVPGVFQDGNRPETMKDTFKLIISDDRIPHNLSHYQLPAIGGKSGDRNGVPRIRPSSWDVDHKYVEIQLPTEKYGRGIVIPSP